MAKAIVTRITGQWSGFKDGAIGGLSVGLLSLLLPPQLASIIGGVIGGAITKNQVVTLNGTMDAVASLFLAARA